MNAVKYHVARTAQGWAPYLEVEFTTRDGRTIPVTGPIMGANLKTGTKPRPEGKLHVAATAQGQKVCAAYGLDFWAIAEDPRTYWATKGGEFFLVFHNKVAGLVEATPVNAWGEATDETGAVIFTEDFR